MARPQKPPAIQIMFVDKDGTSTNGPLLTPPLQAAKRRKLDDEKWSREQTIRRFRQFLRSQDRDGLEATIRALNRHDCWRTALDSLKQGPSPNREMGEALLSFWFTYGLYSIPMAMKENLPQLVDAFRYFLPPYTGQGLTLYRGELESRHMMNVHGISWTPALDVAEMFAARRSSDEGRGVVLRLDATPRMIVAAVRNHSQHTLHLGEDEYLVDPREIQGHVSIVG